MTTDNTRGLLEALAKDAALAAVRERDELEAVLRASQEVVATLRARAERAERQAEALAKAVEQVFAARDTWAGDSGARCVCGCDDDVEALRIALTAYREAR